MIGRRRRWSRRFPSSSSSSLNSQKSLVKNTSSNNSSNNNMAAESTSALLDDSVEDAVLIHLGLNQMAIGSVDTLCGLEIDKEIHETWNEQPPLLTGARNQEETPLLLKGLLRKGIPPPLRCAVWLSNVIQTVHPHQEPSYWHEYRTLSKVRALDHAYETVLAQIMSATEEKFDIDDIWKILPVPRFGQADTRTSSTAPWLGTMTPSGQLARARVLIALDRVTGISFAPLIPTLATLCLKYMSESYAFCTLREMAHAGWYHYFPVSRREQTAWCCAFVDVFTKLHSATAEYLDDRGVFTTESLLHIFQDLFVGILPLKYVLRIVDIYTLEGGKVLFRFGTALLVLFKIYASEELLTISNCVEWWDGMRTWAHAENGRFDFDLVVRKAYGLHGKGVRRQLRFPRRHILSRIIKMEEERLIHEQDNTNDGLDEPPAQPLGLTVSTVTEFDKEAEVPVLAKSTAYRLLLASWMPISLRNTNLELLYSTNYHGRSIEMLYERLKFCKHSILICEAYTLTPNTPLNGKDETNKNKEASSLSSQPTIIGMYASQAWRSSARVYGDGNCFLFRLHPNPKCWKWSPHHPTIVASRGSNPSSNTIQQQSSANLWDSVASIRDSGLYSSASADEFEFDGFGDDDNNNEIALLEQFMVGTRSYISMGGNKDGSAGLRLNEDLTRGESSSSAGYNNDPLHGDEHNSVFDVGLVEVYGLVRQFDGKAVCN